MRAALLSSIVGASKARRAGSSARFGVRIAASVVEQRQRNGFSATV